MTGPSMRHTGDSANIAYYGDQRKDSGLWCEVLRSDFRFVNGKAETLLVPKFHVTLYRQGEEVLNTTYEPKTKPTPGALPARTVTRILRRGGIV